ncbi:Fic family protein (plasmid) [Moraxella lincolnii]|uniref:Fic family protein n=1 Tax=Lwoffella lincolnii TaxID=90241 RepID=UPI0030D0A792
MNQEVIEKLAFSRELEINANPSTITQTFDASHLKSIHAYLFQDSQQERKPGQIRPVIDDVHSKNRSDTYSVRKPFFYQPTPSEVRLNRIISDADNNLRNSESFKDSTQILSKLYAELDYEHPFVEGNSRTIRTFCSQIADRHGIELNWSNMTERMDELYRARDIEIAKMNVELIPTSDIESYMLEEAQRYNTKDYIATQISIHGGRNLQQIIHDCCRPKDNELAFNLSKEQKSAIECMRRSIDARFKDDEIMKAAYHSSLDAQIPSIATGEINLPVLTADVQESIEVQTCNKDNQDKDK